MQPLFNIFASLCLATSGQSGGIYTNSKAAMTKEASEKNRVPWKATCEAELKTWVASVICWSMFKTISFANLYAADPKRVVSWFPNITRWEVPNVTRWEQIKRFFKVSEP